MTEQMKGAQRGWKVIGSKGKFLGVVDQVYDDHLVVKEGKWIHHTLYIPIDHVASAADGQVAVTIPAKEAEAEGWRFPPSSGFHHNKPAMPDVPETTTMQAAGMSSGSMSAPEFQGAISDGELTPGEIPGTELERELEDPENEDEDPKAS
jgi:hypothetical protein